MASTKNNQPPVFPESLRDTPLPDTLVTTYLQMTSSTQFRSAYLNYPNGVKVMCMETPDVAFYRFLYSTVGKPWRLRERLSYSDEQIKAILADPGTSIHVLYVDGAPAGYIELVQRAEGPAGRFYSTEIVYFGLRESYLGQGLGKHLLSHGIAYAWNKGNQRLWLHTSNLDSPYSLDNCLECGFKIYRIEKEPMPKW
ncbi:MAG TPA: N-acetyltransferase [Cyanobacteria bacterium UBA8803]|nr:N-acetyltransferase [Cyanobacteria bacterium UBA9273]HBL62062.1 N-acetyltransferase [Cyanobacteria bacterium UBA8803]